MKREVYSVMMLTLLSMGMLTLALNIETVRADWSWTETVVIQADGSVHPDTAPISTVDNITYTLTDNIVGDVPMWSTAIAVSRDNIVLDGSGHTVEGNEAIFSKGVYLSDRSNVTVKNIKVTKFHYAIRLIHSANSTLIGNQVSNNSFGFYIQSSMGNTLKDNMVAYNNYGISMQASEYNNIVGNSVLNNTDDGIIFSETCSNNNLTDNIVSSNRYGILMVSCSHNVLRANAVSNNTEGGIYISLSSDTSLMENRVINNSGRSGIELADSNKTHIIGNSITEHNYGLTLIQSDDNIIHHNNFVNNTRQVYEWSWDNPWVPCSTNNTWDDGYPSGGNYWSDYRERYPAATEIDDSGIWNTPYVLDEDNQDNYPLMEPYGALPRTINELRAAIEEMGLEGAIDNQGVVTSLLVKLDAAQKLIDNGKTDQATNLLEAFINEVQAQSGKHITPEAADILLQSAEHILFNL